MRTRRLTAIDPAAAEAAIDVCAAILGRGGLVAFPTETVYGLGANARSPKAVQAIFAAKGRPSDNPLIVHAPDAVAAFSLAVGVGEQAHTLAEAFWPGPLSLVLPKGPDVPDEVSAGLDTVALRVPNHPVALALLKRFDGPVAAPSANLSGRPSPTSAEHVWDDLAGRIDAILDGGVTGVGVESTVVDLSGPVPCVLRLGGLPLESLEGLLGSIDVAVSVREKASDEPVRSPGLKYRHYAPQSPVCIITGDRDDVVRALAQLRRGTAKEGRRAAWLISEESARTLGCDTADPNIYVLGSVSDLESVAHRLYAGLRAMDETSPAVILAESFAEAGLGRTVADRLLRAAEGNVVRARDVIEKGASVNSLLERFSSG